MHESVGRNPGGADEDVADGAPRRAAKSSLVMNVIVLTMLVPSSKSRLTVAVAEHLTWCPMRHSESIGGDLVDDDLTGSGARPAPRCEVRVGQSQGRTRTRS